ncbi:hypothetical protein AX15_004457 [Amanita polypyramis BW_CC]|nr:hypothetical protein AX15_004457 [Amanita polypyramis BW_CC]
MKREIGPTDAIDNEAAGCAYVENFALRVFSLADNEDRNGDATRATAKKFLAAANFLEVLNVFPKTEVSDSIDEKIRYAKWKAADIAKAFREGRKPSPGPAASLVSEADPSTINAPADETPDFRMKEETDLPITHETTETMVTNHLPRNAWVSQELEDQPSPMSMTPPLAPLKLLDVDAVPTVACFPSEIDPSSDIATAAPPTGLEDQPMLRFPQPPYSSPSIPSATPHIPSAGGYEPAPTPPIVSYPAPPPSVPIPAPSVQTHQELAPSLIVKVQKHCRFAISALDYEDAEQARKELRAALALLGG